MNIDFKIFKKISANEIQKNNKRQFIMTSAVYPRSKARIMFNFIISMQHCNENPRQEHEEIFLGDENLLNLDYKVVTVMMHC